MKASAYLRSPARDGRCTVSIRYTHQHDYFAIRTGLSVLPAHFDATAGAVRPRKPDANLINGVIEQRKAAIMAAARLILLKGQEPTIERVRAALNGTSEPAAVTVAPVLIAVAPQPVPATVEAKPKRRQSKAKSDRLQELLALYGKGSVHDAASTKNDKTLFVKVLGEFTTWYGQALAFDKTDAALYGQLAEYFLQVRGGYNNVFGKRIKELKSFLRWCELEHDVVVHQGYRKWKVYTEEKEIVFLTEAELELFWQADSLTPQMQKYRDVFVFCCLTGFRWSDVVRSKQMVVRNGLLTIVTQKNRGNAKVPMNEHIQAILDRYDGDLNMVTLQKMNAGIKQLAQRLGIDAPIRYYRHKLKEAIPFETPKHELLSAHCGRRTFITNAFAKGYAVPEILEMIGSTDSRVLLGYLAVTGEHLLEKNKKLRE